VVNDRGRWSRFDKTHGFHDPAMPYVAVRRDGRACVAYGEALGVTCFRYRDGSVSDLQHLGVADGLTSGRVYFLGEDDRERLWVGTGDGVDVVAADGIEHFAETDGLAGNDSAATAFFRDRDGSLWLGSTSGLTHIDAAHYAGLPAPPTTTILGGTLGDRPLTGAVLTAPHDRSSLSVEYAAASFVDTARVEYQVRLSPLEESWASTRSRFARYAALPPGSYRLEVRARAGNGPWGSPASIELAVAEAWWQAGWFLALLVAAGVAAIAGGFALRQRVVLGRRTRQIQAESNASFQALVELLPDLVAAHRDGKVVYLNQAAREILGFPAGDDSFLGRDIQEWVHPDDRPQTEGRATRVASRPMGAVSEALEFRVRAPDGTWRICETTHQVMDFGGAQAVVVTGRDVTEERRMREKVLMSDRMASLGTLAAGIAHEINNPLSYVTGNLEVVADAIDRGDAAAAGPALDELRQALEEAREGAERVRKIVHGLRAFSRPDRPEREALPVDAVLETAIRLTANEIRHRAELVRELGPVPLVAADDGQLAQVFINLLVNAAHAIPEGAADQHRITVRTRTDELGRALIEIEDTGRGMPPEVQARAFDPFFTTRAVGAGAGLGLSICHGIVSGLGGHIGIESAPGRGTLLRVVLPAAPTGADGAGAPDSTSAAP
jgi:PAS domain S-box-containing protein